MARTATMMRTMSPDSATSEMPATAGTADTQEPPHPKMRVPAHLRERRSRKLRAVVFVLAVLAVVMVRPASHHARAASLLMTFSDKDAKPPAVVEERLAFSRDGGSAGIESIPARLYVPRGVPNAPGVVLVHGVHHSGIEEPRLERFARAIAAAGVVVMTPAVKELSDYKVAPRSIGTVAAAVDTLRAKLGTDRVGLMGMSFGGGISLLTAADPRFADHISFVVAVGAHDDLGRVSRFFVNNEIPEPNGETKKLHAHGYGVMVLVYSHASDFFPGEDVPVAREALKLWLWEKRDDARTAANSLSPASKAKIEKLFGEGVSELKGELLAEIDRHTEDMKAVSPHGRLGSIKANVYLLHGEGDTVIPATETLWLAHDVPPERLRTALVSPAIEHVELKSPSPADKWALVHFMGQIIGEAESSR
jgi:pimeloyl-ACP methyl ester carboxylesterase